ncbi:hypothetical protein KPP03845_102729 [Streptomyces xanthophaeus]|uniref:hypothetical protein n=1 Tax=Streptomyces xanthophaeus TaxID=67385 RepID=UPI00233E62AB|nr:hypothetical protein [Streptomyces xanthophaeus]WCD86383.1 hypothetical protein KPP03845_102729 [Streptomyces xanthophaeus]
MKLGLAQIQWNVRVTDQARALGWQVYPQSGGANSRPADPSLILTRGPRVLLVYLRTGRRRADRQPPVERFPDGIETTCWYPEDWPQVLGALAGGQASGVSA